MTNEEITMLSGVIASAVAQSVEQIMAKYVMPANEPKDEDKPKRRGGFRRVVQGGDDVIENQISICEYSDKSYAIYGDTKHDDVLELIRGLKFVNEKTQKLWGVQFCNLSCISESTVGWCVNKTCFEKLDGGLEQFKQQLADMGYEVVMTESVADVKRAKDEAKGKVKKDEPAATTRTEVSTPQPKTEPKAEKPKNEKPKTEKPKAAPVAAKPKTIKMDCYDPSKDAADGYVMTERELVKRSEFYVCQGAKGAIIYACIGSDTDTMHKVAVQIAKVKGDITNAIVPESKAWDEICKMGVVNAVADGKLKANMGQVYGYVNTGDQDAVDALWAKCA